MGGRRRWRQVGAQHPGGGRALHHSRIPRAHSEQGTCVLQAPWPQLQVLGLAENAGAQRLLQSCCCELRGCENGPSGRLKLRRQSVGFRAALVALSWARAVAERLRRSSKCCCACRPGAGSPSGAAAALATEEERAFPRLACAMAQTDSVAWLPSQCSIHCRRTSTGRSLLQLGPGCIAATMASLAAPHRLLRMSIQFTVRRQGALNLEYRINAHSAAQRSRPAQAAGDAAGDGRSLQASTTRRSRRRLPCPAAALT